MYSSQYDKPGGSQKDEVFIAPAVLRFKKKLPCLKIISQQLLPTPLPLQGAQAMGETIHSSENGSLTTCLRTSLARKRD